MALKFTGEIVFIGETEKLGKDPAKPFLKRVVAIDDSDDDRYPNPVPFEFTKDKCKILDDFAVGDVVTATFFPAGHMWKNPKTEKTQYFASNRLLELAKADGGGDLVDDEGSAPEEADNAVSDDLPF